MFSSYRLACAKTSDSNFRRVHRMLLVLRTQQILPSAIIVFHDART